MNELPKSWDKLTSDPKALIKWQAYCKKHAITPGFATKKGPPLSEELQKHFNTFIDETYTSTNKDEFHIQ